MPFGTNDIIVKQSGGFGANDEIVSESQVAEPQQAKDTSEPWYKAAAHGFSQGVTLGAGKYGTAGIQALIYKAAGGKGKLSDAYDEFVQENTAEEERLKKEHGIAYGLGEAGSFLVPGSGSAQAFKLGAKGVEAGLGATKLGKFALESGSKMATLGTLAAKGAGGMALAGGLKTGIETGSAPEAARQAVEQGAFGAGATIGLGAIGSAVKPVAGAVSTLAKGAVSKITGTPWEAMSAYAKNPEAIRAAAGTEKDLGQELVTHMQAIKEENIAESQQARELLKRIGPANLIKVKTAMQEVVDKKPLSPEEAKVQANLKDWLENYLPKGTREKAVLNPKTLLSPDKEKEVLENIGKVFTKESDITAKVTRKGRVELTGPEQIPAEQMEEVKRALQAVANKYYGQEGVPAYIQTIKQAGFEARQALLRAAEESKVPEYGKLMEQVAAKVKTRNDLDDFLGKVIEDKPNVAARMFELLNTKSTAGYAKLKALDRYDEMFGTKFREQAENAIIAKKLGRGGRPQLLSQVSTGALTLPSIVGGGGGAALGLISDIKRGKGVGAGTIGGLAAGLALSSPAAWSSGIANKNLIVSLAKKVGVKKALEMVKKIGTAQTSKSLGGPAGSAGVVPLGQLIPTQRERE